MKYLKRYNESVEGSVEVELRDFCETNLAYLIDEGFELSVGRIRPKNLNFFNISILRANSDLSYFKWNSIKDHIIPFLTHLSKRYEIKGLYNTPPIEIYFRDGNNSTGDLYLSLDEILDETGHTKLLEKDDSFILGMWIKIKIK
jgi:hypothetical protein